MYFFQTDKFKPLGFQQITDLSASTGLTVPSGDIAATIGGTLPSKFRGFPFNIQSQNTGSNYFRETLKPRYTFIQCDTADVRWTDDGTTPTSTKGMLLTATSTDFILYPGDPTRLKFIQTAANAKLNVEYYY